MKIKEYLQEATGRRGIPWATMKGGKGESMPETPWSPKTSGFKCQECGYKFKTQKAAEKAAFGEKGCPRCGSSDVDY